MSIFRCSRRFPCKAQLDIRSIALIASQPRATEKPDGSFSKQMASYGISRNDPSDVFWNFEKFLVARDGTVVGRFTSDFTPEDPLLADAIENELKKPIGE